MPDKKCNKCGGVHAAPRGKKCTVGDEALDGVTLMDTLLNRISQLAPPEIGTVAKPQSLALARHNIGIRSDILL